MTSLRVLVIVLGAAIGVYFPFISVILADRGFGPGQIGLITSLAAIGATIAVPTWGHLADVRFGRARTLRICAFGGALAVAALLIAWPPGVVVALVVAFWVFECSWQPLTDAITVNALGGRAGYARIRLLTSLAFAVSVVLAGLIYEQTGYWAAFVLFATGGVIMGLATFKVPDVGRADLARHAAHTPTAGVASAGGPVLTSEAPRTWRFGSSGVALRIAPKLPLVLLAVALLHVGIISGFTFLSLRLLELGAGPAEVALASGLSGGMEVPSMMVAGWVAVRIGLRGMFAGSAILYAGCLALWAVTDQPALIVASRLVTGVAMAWVIVSIVLTIARLLPADLQATGQALFQMTAFGVASVIANVLGGFLYATIGHEAVFGLGAVLAVMAAGVGWLVIPRRPSVTPAVAR